MYYIWEK